MSITAQPQRKYKLVEVETPNRLDTYTDADIQFAFQDNKTLDFIVILQSGERIVYHGDYIVRWTPK